MSTNVSAVTSYAGSPDSSFVHKEEAVDDAPQPNPTPPPPPSAPAHPASRGKPEPEDQPASVRNCFTMDSPPPPPPPLGAKADPKGETTTKKKLELICDETCPFCSFDSARVISDLSKLQYEVSKLAMRMEMHDDRTAGERVQIDRCLSQLQEYTVSLGVVGKWTSSVGMAIPRFLRTMASSATVVEPSEVLVRSECIVANAPTTPTDEAQDKENKQQQQQQQHQQQNVSAVLNTSSISAAGTNATNATAAYIPISEVRGMFSQFRDEIVRLKERNVVLEQRLNDAVNKFEGSSINKLKADVEGRLRTMLHSLHETMNGGGSPTSELAQQVSALRTEVEMVKSKTEAAAGSRSVMEARINDTAAKLRELADGQMERSRHEQQQVGAQREELRDLRAAMKELGMTVSQRLDSERSAREFESGDIRSQLRVLLRSPSPMARLGDPRSPSAMMM